MTRVLNVNKGSLLFIPELVAHGYQTLEPESTVNYVLFGEHSVSAERVLAWDEPTLNIPWPRGVAEILPRDREGMSWNELISS